MKFSARSVQILRLLLEEDKPIPARELAEELEISKRTVFRELKSLDSQLKESHLEVDTKSKRGIILKGPEEDKQQLLETLDSLDHDDPANKEERRNRLLLELLKQEEIQKMYYYASLLKVSEGTINSDLDVIDRWLEESNINLVRKSGLGVYLDYQEEDYRRACMRYLYQDSEHPLKTGQDLIEGEIIEKVKEVVEEMQDNRLSTMTESSYEELIIYLAIMTKRILIGKQNTAKKNIDITAKNIKDYQYVIELSAALGSKFQLQYNTTEIIDLYNYLRGAKLQYVDESQPLPDNDPGLRGMIYEMINRYDPGIAHLLKQDSQLIKGLTTHLSPTVIRLQNGIQINNPFQKEIREMYPEVYGKAEHAAEVIGEAYDVTIPEEEIGLLAIHFGGAELKLKSIYRRSRKVNIGVICPVGIGMSTLISSRLSHIFHDRARVQTLSYNDLVTDRMEEFDIIVSTFNIEDSTFDYIQVDPMLSEENIGSVEREIEKKSKEAVSVFSNGKTDTLSKVTEIRRVTDEILSIIRNFQLCTLDADIEMEDMMAFIGKTLGRPSEEYIYEDLKKREAIATQVIPEYELVFLHAKTRGVEESKFIIIKPDAESFQKPYFAKAKVVVVMLIPEEDPRNTLAIASISTALFEENSFLREVKNGSVQLIRQYIERILKEYLKEQIGSL